MKTSCRHVELVYKRRVRERRDAGRETRAGRCAGLLNQNRGEGEDVATVDVSVAVESSLETARSDGEVRDDGRG